MSLELQKVQEWVSDFFSVILAKVENGELAPTNAYIFLKKLEKAFEACKEKVYEMAKTELDNYNALELEKLPYNASAKRINRVTYEYKQNARYAEMEKALKAFKELIEVATKNQTAVTDPESGEQIYAVDTKTTVIYQMKVD